MSEPVPLNGSFRAPPRPSGMALNGAKRTIGSALANVRNGSKRTNAPSAALDGRRLREGVGLQIIRLDVAVRPVIPEDLDSLEGEMNRHT